MRVTVDILWTTDKVVLSFGEAAGDRTWKQSLQDQPWTRCTFLIFNVKIPVWRNQPSHTWTSFWINCLRAVLFRQQRQFSMYSFDDWSTVLSRTPASSVHRSALGIEPQSERPTSRGHARSREVGIAMFCATMAISQAADLHLRTQGVTLSLMYQLVRLSIRHWLPRPATFNFFSYFSQKTVLPTSEIVMIRFD